MCLFIHFTVLFCSFMAMPSVNGGHIWARKMVFVKHLSTFTIVKHTKWRKSFVTMICHNWVIMSCYDFFSLSKDPRQ